MYKCTGNTAKERFEVVYQGIPRLPALLVELLRERANSIFSRFQGIKQFRMPTGGKISRSIGYQRELE